MTKTYRFALEDHTAQLTGLRAGVKIDLSEDEEGKLKGPPSFSSLAYSGDVVPGYTATPPLPHDYIVDLGGMEIGKGAKANLDHKTSQRVGHVTHAENDQKQLRVDGLLSAATTFRDEVINSTRESYEWEVSMEGLLQKPRKLAAGKTDQVNGRIVKGPLLIFQKSLFTGLAFVSTGADIGNAVAIAASTDKGKPMNDFQKWLIACGIDNETLDEKQRTSLEAAYKAQLDSDPPDDSPTRKSFAKEAEALRRQQDRQESIKTMALSAMREYPTQREKIGTLTEAALESDTDPKDFELELLRNTRVSADAFSGLTSGMRAENDPLLIEAAICMSAGMPSQALEKHFGAETLDKVDRAGMRNFSLQQLLMRVAHSNGYTCRPGDRIHTGNVKTILEYAFPPATARLSGGFSTIDMPNILGNVANKEILAGYMEADNTWEEISEVKPVNNFHQVTSYRMLDNLEYEEVGGTGEIKHGTISEESYTRQAKTYAKMLGLTRTDIINDDLGAFDDIRKRLGMGAAKKFNDIFWAAFLNNASFFTAALTNYIEGATSNLGTDGVGLELGVTAFRQRTTPATDGTKRMGVSGGRPTKLLVPPELEFIADRLFSSGNVNPGGGSSDTFVPDRNIHAGKYRPIVQDRLSDSAFTGYSTTAWYLFGALMQPMVVSFLFGNRTPIVESTDADFNMLGIQFRGYHDFGADKSEYLAGIKSKGAA